MKKKTLLLSLTLLSTFCCFAQSTTGPMGPVGPTGATGPTGSASPAMHTPTPTETWITFLPGIFFLIVLILTTIKLRKSQVKISDILAEKDKNGAAIPNSATPPNTPPAPLPPVQSASRFIAFLTGLVALTIGTCLTIFFIYTYFSTHKPADLSNLSTVIWGLGIGVIPYGTNKVSSALKP